MKWLYERFFRKVIAEDVSRFVSRFVEDVKALDKIQNQQIIFVGELTERLILAEEQIKKLSKRLECPWEL